MSTRSSRLGIALAIAAFPAVIAAADKPALNVRLGLWETTSTTTVGGQMPAIDTSKMTPEQKARVEAMMKQALGGRSQTSKSCLTQDKLDRGTLTNEQDRPDCTTTVAKNTSTVLDATQVCTGDNPRTIQLHFEAQSPTSVTGTFKSAETTKGRRMTVDGTITSRWLSADCGDEK